MFWSYLAYLAFTLMGSVLLAYWQRVSFAQKTVPLLLSLLSVAIVFAAWDILAVYANHWQFNLEFMLGPLVINQPIEEIGFFIVIPFFYIVVWEIAKKWGKP